VQDTSASTASQHQAGCAGSRISAGRHPPVGSLFDRAAFARDLARYSSTGRPGCFITATPRVPKHSPQPADELFPRLGLVWNLHGGRSRTIRVGGAILYDSPEVFYGPAAHVPMRVRRRHQLNTAAGPFNDPWLGYLGGAIRSGKNPPRPTVTFRPRRNGQRAAEQGRRTWRSGMSAYQRQFAKDWLASVSYLGNDDPRVAGDRHQSRALHPGASTTGNVNQPALVSWPGADGQVFRRPVQYDAAGTRLNNGVLASGQHRFSRL